MGFFKDLSFLNMIMSKDTGDFISNALIHDYMSEEEKEEVRKKAKKDAKKNK